MICICMTTFHTPLWLPVMHVESSLQTGYVPVLLGLLYDTGVHVTINSQKRKANEIGHQRKGILNPTVRALNQSQAELL